MSYRGSEIARPRLLNNQRPSKYAPKPKKVKARDRREGMSEAHLAAIRKLWCVITGRRPVDAHHLQGGIGPRKERGLGLKPTDKWCIPLDWRIHAAVHGLGSKREAEFFDEHGYNPYELADALWKATPDHEKMGRILEAFQEEARKIVDRRKIRFKASVGRRQCL